MKLMIYKYNVMLKLMKLTYLIRCLYYSIEIVSTVCCYGGRVINNQGVISYVKRGSAITRTSRCITLSHLKKLVNVACWFDNVEFDYQLDWKLYNVVIPINNNVVL